MRTGFVGSRRSGYSVPPPLRRYCLVSIAANSPTRSTLPQNMAGGFYEGFGGRTRRLLPGLVVKPRQPQSTAAPTSSVRSRRRDYDPGALTDQTRGLGIRSAWSKPLPACKANQETMRLIRSLQPAGLAASEIERVILTRPARDYDAPGICAEPRYPNQLLALISAKFTAIATLLGRPVTQSRYGIQMWRKWRAGRPRCRRTRARKWLQLKFCVRLARRSPCGLQMAAN
ncbi:hypothetical protein SAMN05216337_1010123 [Bradyrhizobium brasilense]|uniref:Uncharacterized protein n=1 Tax=Bradyrhizobium brasilense TaxID=1419277 RepID=A0A1G6U6M7_9BRAD|nr:hypothetical protein SAMN05216337_1010123 [Bradyrhizobium brasilense]